MSDPFDELRQQLEAAKAAVKAPGSLPLRIGNLILHSKALDPSVPGRVRVSYRSPDYVDFDQVDSDQDTFEEAY